MADILIRGFDMPTDASLWLLIRPDGTVHKLKVGGKHGEPQQGVAVPLPEGHGRLGDLDALDKFLHEKENEADAEEFYLAEAWYNTFRQILRVTQTIVPAEGGTDNA